MNRYNYISDSASKFIKLIISIHRSFPPHLVSKLNINRYFYVETIFLHERQGFVFSPSRSKTKRRKIVEEFRREESKKERGKKWPFRVPMKIANAAIDRSRGKVEMETLSMAIIDLRIE